MSSSVAKKQGWNRKKGDPALPGAGRPKGSIGNRAKMIRAVAERALKPGKTPLDVMLRNMRFYDSKAEALLHVLEEKIGDMKSPPLELLELLKEMSGYRMSAQKCAVDAAPFVHPRLASIEHRPADNQITRAEPEAVMSDDQLSEFYNKLRSRPTDVAPLEIITIDNETGELVDADEED